MTTLLCCPCRTPSCHLLSAVFPCLPTAWSLLTLPSLHPLPSWSTWFSLRFSWASASTPFSASPWATSLPSSIGSALASAFYFSFSSL